MECPSCHEECDEIYQCKDCDTMFCFGCKEVRMIDAFTMGLDGGIGGWCCPKCGGRGTTMTSEHEEPEKEQKQERAEDCKDDDTDNCVSNSYSGTGTASGGEFGLGTVLFGIPFGWAVAYFVLWVVGALALSFLLFMADANEHSGTNITNCGNVVHRDDCWSILFRWSSYVALPVTIGGAAYCWYRVLSNPATWQRIGTQCIWILVIILVIFFLNIIGKLLGSLG